MKKMALLALGGAFVAGSAGAAIQNSGIQFNSGDYNVADTNTTAGIFESFNNAPEVGTTAGMPFVNYSPKPGITETANGNVVVFSGTTNTSGKGFSPDGGGDNYVAVGGNGPMGALTVTFTTAQQYFSFAFGTLDNFNSVILGFANGTYQTLTGSQITQGNGGVTGPLVTPTPPTTPGTYGTTGRVAYNAQGGSGITSVTFYSSQAAFEIDDLAAAAPEPATWAMMIMGFGLAGSALRLRRRKATVAFA